MKCIYCKKKGSEVLDTRETGKGIRRRRKCSYCGELFTTTETALSENLFVEKRVGRRERFNRDKLFVSIFTILDGGKGRDNGELAKKSRDITDTICKKVLAQKEKVIRTDTLVKMVYKELSHYEDFYGQKYMLYSPYRVKILRGR